MRLVHLAPLAILLVVQINPTPADALSLDFLNIFNKVRCGVNIATSTLKSGLNKLTKTPVEITPDNQEAEYVKFVSEPPALEPKKLKASGDLFTEELMYRYGMYAGIAYCDEADARSLSNIVIGPNATRLLTADMHILSWNSKHGNHYFVAKSDEQHTITVSFRGTSSLADMVADLDSRKVDPDASLGATPSASRIYSGLQSVIIPQFSDAIKDLRAATEANPDYGVVLTGHSLGGVAAHLFALYLQANMGNATKLTGVFTYGEPISMSENMAEWSLQRIGRERYVRTVSSDDIAPWIRTSDGEFGHATNGKVIYLPNPKQRTMIRCEKSDDNRCGANQSCTKLGWTNHSWYGGMFVGKRQCLYGRERKNPLLDVPEPDAASAITAITATTTNPALARVGPITV
ncbi:Alpha/Beta hydrolase protein [Syncephalis plumigaleata]|nr:Alpha/Beta hydrolase protein [Syncephalis plumigaleata]